MPEEEQEENAKREAGAIPLKNATGENLPRVATKVPYTMRAWSTQPAYTQMITLRSGRSTAGPLAATTGVIKPNTPNGAKLMMMPTIL